MYVPSFLKAALTNSRPLTATLFDLKLSDSNINDKSSFKYEPLNYPIKNTQQLNLDWSKFENHTFFSSAEAKVNITFEKIINGFPFDGTKKEIEVFLDSLGGFEKWVFNKFPKFSGQLHFSGSWIFVKDVSGWLYPELSKKPTGETVINPPANKSFTIESQIFIPDETNSTQVILQKQSSDISQGFTLHLEPSTTSFVTASFSINSGSFKNHVSAKLKKGVFNHICVSLNRETDDHFLQFFVNEQLQQESKKEKKIGILNNTSDLLIGSGSSFYSNNTYVTPVQTFSGTLDELRVFHSYRTLQQQKVYKEKGLYATEDLKLYYRFNEPPTPLSSNPYDITNAIVLDSSGNSLHTYITNFTSSLRQSAENDTLSNVNHERNEFKIILFPYNPDLLNLNADLLFSASSYDNQNPNLITKLVPRHYFAQGAEYEGYNDENIEGTITKNYSGEGIPGEGVVGSTQLLISFLYIWSKMFDEIKMFVDSFRTLKTVNYQHYETVPDNFLVDLIKSYGMHLPPLFNSSNIQQYSNGEDITKLELNDVSLKAVQSQLLRRVLINMPDILRSKGTQHSIKSFLRAIGIDPDRSMRIREFGGPSTQQLESCREVKTEYSSLVNFSSSSLVTTQYLSGSRIEPGYPEAVGPFVKGVSAYESDGLFTSGSWTFEGLYKSTRSINDRQSLARLEVTGSSALAQQGLIVNLVYDNEATYAYFRPGMSTTSPVLELSIPANVLNGEKWNVSFGRNRNDSIDSNVSSSYFLRAATQSEGEVSKIYMTSSFFNETPLGEGNALQLISSTLNASGSRISIGNDPNIPEGIGYIYLNNTIDSNERSREYSFSGLVSNVKFWSKALTEDEWKEHVKNYKSYGTENPFINYNYVTNLTGSFEKLRLSILEKQNIKTTNSDGTIKFLDFSENCEPASGTGFPSLENVHKSDIFSYSYVSPYFDEYSTSEKIRIRGVLNEESLNITPASSLGPVYEIPAGETPLDDPRLSIEFSLIDSLNRDIINLFSNLDALSNAIGSPELAFSPDYPDLERLRDIYFNRISEKLNFRSFFEFYRWFDTSISTFIEQLIPRKTMFKGTNFVVESHMLERHKMEYQSSEIYLGDATRSRLRDTILVQQVTGIMKKY